MTNAPDAIPAQIHEPAAADAGGEVRRHKACSGCGYDLKGLERDGTCPECGTPVADSYRPNVLRYASRGYLADLRRAVMVLKAASWAVVGLFIWSFTASAAAKFAGPSFAWIDELSRIVGVVPVTAFLVGVWMLAEPDPRAGGSAEAAWSPRRLMRVLAIAALMAALVMTVAHVLRKPATGGILRYPKTMTEVPWYAARAVRTFLLAGACWATLAHVAALARRVPDRKLAEKSTFWSSGAFLVLIGGFMQWVALWIVIGRVKELGERLDEDLSDAAVEEAAKRESAPREGSAA